MYRSEVRAISVHGVCGAWGTIAAALLHENLFLGLEYDWLGALSVQLIGVAGVFFWTFTTAFILFKVIAATVGLRVSREEELEGLDLSEHVASCYPDFVTIGRSYTGVPPLASGARVPMSVAPKQEAVEI